MLHARNKTGEARKYWDLAVESSTRTYSSKNWEHANILVNAGDFFTATGQKDKALSLYQRAMVQVYPCFNSLDPKDNPAADFAFVESWAMTVPARKGQLLAEWFQK
ncbi:MAG: tetratricopeptide repeat protein [Saprospirales bacterium]|nr:tetratricopeptide repeat protein [Saprospirales bacterium]